MTQKTSPAPSDPTQPVNIQIGLGAQYIKDFSFESPNTPQVFTSLHLQPQMMMDVKVLSRSIGEGTFESVLKIKLESKLGDATAFIAELAYAGLFALPELSTEQAKMFLLIEAPRLLFPFARAILTNAVREGGFPNIVLQPIDFMTLYNTQHDKIGAEVAAGAA